MFKLVQIVALLLTLFYPLECPGQDSLSFNGQASGWINVNSGNSVPVYLGARYIPQLDFAIPLKDDRKIDFEGSVNIDGSLGFDPFDPITKLGRIKLLQVLGQIL